MTALNRTALALATVLVSGSLALAGQSTTPTAPTKSRFGAPPPAVHALVLVASKILTTTSSGVTPLGAGFQNVDAGVNLTCTVICTLGAEQMIQLSGTAANNAFAICTRVDGNLLSTPSCPFGGIVPTSGFLVANGSQTAFNLPPGTHHINTQIFSNSGVNVSNWNFIYRYYKA